jgi:hypothetical protein
LDDLLGGVQGFINLVAEGFVAHRLGKGFDDVERDVRFQESPANFPDGFVDIGGLELSFCPQGAEGLGQPIGE